MPTKLIDLTHPIYPGMPVYQGDRKPKKQIINSMEKDNFRQAFLSFGTHTGTHIDAPAHLLEDGKFLDEFTLSAFCGKAGVIDCRNLTAIGVGHLEALMPEEVPEFILLYTCCDRSWGKESYFRKYPVLTADAAQYLCQLKIKGVGIDAPSFDPYDSVDYPIHSVFLRNEIILVENLCRLGDLPLAEFLFCCLPLNFRNADGSPVRACGILYNEPGVKILPSD